MFSAPSGRVEPFLRAFFRPKCHNPEVFVEECIDEYVRAYSQPGALRGGFSYYRAMFTENRALDAADHGKRIAAPTLVLWGTDGGLTVFESQTKRSSFWIVPAEPASVR